MHNYEPSGLGEGREGTVGTVCCNMSWRVEGVVEKINTLSPSTYKKKLHMTNGGRQKESNSKSRTPD